jgi:hypothetical protein
MPRGATLVECLDCGSMFRVTAAERQFYRARCGAPWRPSLCRDCRIRRREERAESLLVLQDDAVEREEEEE